MVNSRVLKKIPYLQTILGRTQMNIKITYKVMK